MTTIKIEKGVPIPATREFKSRQKYPFADMVVSDSFAIPLGTKTDKHGTPKSKTRISSAVYNFRKRSGMNHKFIIRTLYSKNEVRCWRVA